VNELIKRRRATLPQGMAVTDAMQVCIVTHVDVVAGVGRLSAMYVRVCVCVCVCVCVFVYVSILKQKPVNISISKLAGEQYMTSPGRPFYLSSEGQMSSSS